MFYLKYRPQKFSELVKPNLVGESLASQVKSGKVSHAYLFTGSRGTGKTTTARILAKAVNCLNLDKFGDPCDKCANCVAIREGKFLDLIEIDAASNRGIDDIRVLRDKITFSPAVGKKKVYIIDEVHMLTTEAFNALLKTLEEPPSHAMFILCTTEVNKVPETIKSRCQVFNFKKATLSQLKEKLQKIASMEGADLSEEDALEIARASLGGYRDAETMLQQILDGHLNTQNLVGFGSCEEISCFVSNILENQVSLAFLFVEKNQNQGVEMKSFVNNLLEYLKSLLFMKMGFSDGLPEYPDVVMETLKKQSQMLEVSDLTFLISRFIKCDSALSLELAIAEICSKNNPGNFSKGPGKPPKKTSPSPDPTLDASPKNEGPVQKKEDSKTQDIKTNQEEIKNNTGNPDLETIKREWNKVLSISTKYNHSIRALLKATQPVKIEEGTLTLEVKFAFHKDRLEVAKNREIVEQTLYEALGQRITFSCIICDSTPIKRNFGETGNLTDLNVVIPSSKDVGSVNIDSSLLNVFDGNLPL